MLAELCLGAFLIYLLWKCIQKPYGLPPGKWGLPLIGYIPLSALTGKSTRQQLEEMRMKYGDIFLWRMGTRTMLFLFDYHTIKDVFGRPDFTNRPEFNIFRITSDGQNCGLLSSNGIVWQNGRRFALRHLRDLGMGKSSLVEAIQYEAVHLVEDMKNMAGKPQPLPDSINVCVLNVIWKMVANIRYEKDEPRLQKFRSIIRDLQAQLIAVVVPDYFPWLSTILPEFIGTRLFRKDIIAKFATMQKQFLQEIIDDHEKNLDPYNPKDYIDAYLLEMKEKENDLDSTFSKVDLVKSISDLFGAGSETITVTLIWIFFYLANYQEVQQRLQKEVDEILPQGILARLEHRPRLPYTEAVINEVHRIASFIRVGVVHAANQDTHIGEYNIPKDTVVNAVFEAVHHDSKLWDDPGNFRPERFLDADGKFVPVKEGFLPFSTGKRQCLGEALAKMELLIFLTTVVQSLNFSPPEGKNISLKPVETPLNNLPDRKQDILVTIRNKQPA